MQCTVRQIARNFALRLNKKPSALEGFSASDGARTRDLRRDRPAR